MAAKYKHQGVLLNVVRSTLLVAVVIACWTAWMVMQ